MIWKTKQKEYSREEAIELAVKGLAPYWFGISPQMIGIKSQEKDIAIPLDAEFSKKAWLMFFADISTFDGLSMLLYAKEWFARYSEHQLNFLFFIYPCYSFISTEQFIHKFIEEQGISFPVVVDMDLAISRAFQAEILPKMVLTDQDSIRFENQGMDAIEKSELDVQQFLRSKDPGLSLFPVVQFKDQVFKDVKRVEFGMPEIEGIQKSGQWKQDSSLCPGCWMTNDSTATLRFLMQGSILKIIAAPLSKDVPEIIVELDGIAIYEGALGPDTHYSDNGQTAFEVTEAGVYTVIERLATSKEHEVVLKFVNAKEVPVAIFGVRVGG